MNNKISEFFEEIQFFFRYHTKFNFFLSLEIIFASSLILGYVLSFISIPSPEIQSEFLRFIFNLLISVNFIFFSLSITAYTLAVKLTQKYTLNKWIVEEIKIEKIVLIFIINILIHISLFSLMAPFQLSSNLWFELFGIIIPSMILIIISVRIVLKTINVTSTKKIIQNFLGPKAQKERYKFNFRLLQKSFRKTPPQNSLKRILSPPKIKSFVATKLFKEITPTFIEMIDDALNTLIEVEGAQIPTETEIPTILGIICAPPYIGLEFTRDNLIIKINGMVETFPASNFRFIPFIGGFIKGLLQNEFIDAIILGAVEHLIILIKNIGYKKLDNTRQKVIFDVTNNVLFEIAEQMTKIHTKLDDDSEKYIFKRIINQIASIYAGVKTDRPLVIGVMMKRIADLTDLKLDLQTKASIITKIIDLVKKIAPKQSWGLMGVFLFSIMQIIWKNILSERLIKEGIEKAKSQNHSRLLVSFIILKSIDELMKLTVNYPKFENSLRVSPMLFNMNRIFIDLTYYLAYIYKKTKNNEVKNVTKKLFIDVLERNLTMNKEIKTKNPTIDIKNLMASPSIISLIGIDSGILSKDEFLEILKTQDIFDSHIIFGTELIYETIFGNQLINHQKLIKFLSSSLKQIEETFSADHLSTFLHQIETRQGYWPGLGYHIGQIILISINALADKRLIAEFLKKLKNE